MGWSLTGNQLCFMMSNYRQHPTNNRFMAVFHSSPFVSLTNSESVGFYLNVLQSKSLLFIYICSLIGSNHRRA